MTKTTPSSTSHLSGNETAPPAAAASDSVAQLKVQKAGPTKVSPTQQRFNGLLRRVENLGEQLQTIERLSLEVRTPHMERMAALDQQAQQSQSEMLFFLHERLQRKGLTSAQKKSAYDIVAVLVETLDNGSEDPQWVALRAEYLGGEEDGQPLHEMKQEILKDLENMLGMPIDLGDMTQFETPEQMIEAVMRYLEEHAQAENQRHRAAHKAKRPATDKQNKAQAQAQEQEQDAKAALRSIYRQLASALHPDRETDPAEHQRKSALMSQANAAYKRGDLTTLLRLQLQEQQVDHASIARMADDRLAALSLLLKNQVATLEKELMQAEMRLSGDLGVGVHAGIKKPHLNRLLREVQQELVHQVQAMQHDLKRVQRDDTELKRWLREQVAMAKEKERLDAMSMQFRGFY